MAHFFVKWLLYPLMRLLFVKEIKGLDNLPDKGPFIIAANHASYIDGPLILLALLWHRDRSVHFIIYKKMFTTWFRRFVFWTWFNQIKENHSTAKALEFLKHGKIVGIFPEGSRTWTGELQRMKHTGLGVLALESGCAVVPVGIKGTFKLWPKTQKWPCFRRIVTLSIGRPRKFNLRMNKKNYKTVVEKVMKQVARLADKKYVK